MRGNRAMWVPMRDREMVGLSFGLSVGVENEEEEAGGGGRRRGKEERGGRAGAGRGAAM